MTQTVPMGIPLLLLLERDTEEVSSPKEQKNENHIDCQKMPSCSPPRRAEQKMEIGKGMVKTPIVLISLAWT